MASHALRDVSNEGDSTRDARVLIRSITKTQTTQSRWAAAATTPAAVAALTLAADGSARKVSELSAPGITR